MAITVALQDALRPMPGLVAPQLTSLFRKQLIFARDKAGEVKVEIEHDLGDFDDLPFSFDSFKTRFRVVNFGVLASGERLLGVLGLMAQSPKNLEKEFGRISNQIYRARVSKRITLRQYQLTSVYLRTLKDYFLFSGTVIGKISAASPLETVKKYEKLTKNFGSQIENYLLSFLAFICFIYIIEKNGKIRAEEVFRTVNFYSTQLNMSHARLAEAISGLDV
ncbi:MAG: hypothetical protein V1676_07710 [Candidatus Diapherotrites archaeon]